RSPAEPGDRDHGRQAGSCAAPVRALARTNRPAHPDPRRPSRVPGGRHRIRLRRRLHAAGGRVRLETVLHLADGHGWSGPRQGRGDHRGTLTAAGIRASGVPPAPAPRRAQRRSRHGGTSGARMSASPATSAERRRRNQKAEIVTVHERSGAGREQGALHDLRLPRRIRRLQRHAPLYAMQGLGELSTRLRQLTGHDVIDMNRVMELIQFAYRQRELAMRGPDYAVDDFGFDPQFTESFLPLFMAIYRDYWRVETTGVENVPAAGRALLVANHAGVLPWDGAMIKTSLSAEPPHPRHVRALVASLFMGMPVLSWFLRRTGQTVGHPDDTRRLLDRDQLVLVFPEGVRGTGKLYAD